MWRNFYDPLRQNDRQRKSLTQPLDATTNKMKDWKILTVFSCWRRLSRLFAGWHSEVDNSRFSCCCSCAYVGSAVAHTLAGGVGDIQLLIVSTVLIWLALVLHRASSFLQFSCHRTLKHRWTKKNICNVDMINNQIIALRPWKQLFKLYHPITTTKNKELG